MPYCDAATLVDYFNSSAYADWPVRAPTCAFVDGGAGIPGPVLSLLVFGTIGMTMSYRVQHPGPIVVSGILVAGVFTANAPANMVNIIGLVLLIGLSIAGLYLYQRAQRAL